MHCFEFGCFGLVSALYINMNCHVPLRRLKVAILNLPIPSFQRNWPFLSGIGNILVQYVHEIREEDIRKSQNHKITMYGFLSDVIKNTI